MSRYKIIETNVKTSKSISKMYPNATQNSATAFLSGGKGQKCTSTGVQRGGNVGGEITSLRKGEIGKVLSIDSVENEDYDVKCGKYPGQFS